MRRWLALCVVAAAGACGDGSYSDSDAVDAMGSEAPDNSMNHSRYSDSECLAAVAAAGFLASEVDPTVNALGKMDLGACAAGQVAKFDGAGWSCQADADTLLDEAAVDAMVSNNGFLSSEVDPTVNSLGTAALSCADGEVPKWFQTPMAWACAPDDSGAVGPWEAATGGITYMAGNVGIGTTTPAEPLDVAGKINTSMTLRARRAVIHAGVGWSEPLGDHDLFVAGRVLAYNAQLTNPLTRNRGYDLTNDKSYGMEIVYVGPQPASTYATAVYARTGHHLRLGHYPADSGAQADFVTAVDIDPAGQVGIGKEFPAEALDVVGNIYATGAIVAGSSRKLKRDIRPLTVDSALAAVDELRPVRYYYRADGRDEHIGFIAEDVPELVADPDRRGVSPVDVVAVLTRVVQEQRRQLRQQQEQLDALAAAVHRLEQP